MSLFGLSIRGMRDGALLGILLYSLAYALYRLHDALLPVIGTGTARTLLDDVQELIGSTGMAGAGYFALGGACIGAIPWGSMFGKGDEAKRKKA